MAGNKFVLCFNALEQRFFEVQAIHMVDDPYRRNYYRFCLRLNFFEDDLNRIDDMRQFCLRKITILMTEQKLWQNLHSFYVIQYEIRTMERKSNNLIQQNNDEGDEDTSDDDSVSTANTHESSNADSAYSSASDNNHDLKALNDSCGDSFYYQENEALESGMGDSNAFDTD